MRKFMGFVSIAVMALGLNACESGYSYPEWSTGLHVKGTAIAIETTEHYRQTPQGDAFKSKGAIAAGNLVSQSSGTFLQTVTLNMTRDWTVVGQTDSQNPLIPGEPDFSGIPVSLVEGTDVFTTNTSVIETTISEGPNGAQQVTATSNSTAPRETEAWTIGLTGDEYIIAVTDLDLLWDPDLVEKWHTDRTAFNGNGVTYWVKNDPQKGDVWVHPDGHTLYKAVGLESVPVGNSWLDSMKLELRKVASVNEASVRDRCLLVVQDKVTQSTIPNASGSDGEFAVQKITLDPGCEGNFVHYREGFEWWHKNVMVKASLNEYSIEIKSSGWEWVQDKTLVRSDSIPVISPPAAQAYVEYAYTKTNVEWNVQTYETTVTPWTVQ